MSFGEESLSTEIFLIDMLYSPVCAVLGETLIKLVQTGIAQRADCECACLSVIQIDGLFKTVSRQQTESDEVAKSLRK